MKGGVEAKQRSGPESQTHVGARLLSPDPEHFGASRPVAGGGRTMLSRPEMIVDHAVRGEERVRSGPPPYRHPPPLARNSARGAALDGRAAGTGVRELRPDRLY